MMKSIAPRFPGLAVTLLGVGFAVGALSYGVTNGGRMAPGMLPMLCGVALVALGLMIMLTAGRPVRGQSEKTPVVASAENQAAAVAGRGKGVPLTEDSDTAPGRHGSDPSGTASHPARPWLILATMAAALAVAPYLGLIPALAIGAFIMLKFIERESWWLSAGVTVALLVGAWFIFEGFLNVHLPWGVFGGAL